MNDTDTPKTAEPEYLYMLDDERWCCQPVLIADWDAFLKAMVDCCYDEATRHQVLIEMQETAACDGEECDATDGTLLSDYEDELFEACEPVEKITTDDGLTAYADSRGYVYIPDNDSYSDGSAVAECTGKRDA